jgi:hypothetical protein
MIEDIDKTFLLIGEDITFPIIGLTPSFVIKAIPDFNLNTLYKEAGTVYEVEVQTIYFTLKTSDCKANNIVQDMTFTLFDGTYTHTFSIESTPVHDFTGWSRIAVDWVSKV